MRGQVFVVLPTGESLRLGSVQVQVFEESVIRPHLENREAEIAARQAVLRERVHGIEEEIESQEQGQGQMEEAYRQREAEIRKELEELARAADERTAALEAKMKSNETFIANADSVPPPPAGIPTRQEYEDYSRRRAKWLSMSQKERQAWASVLASLNEDLAKEIKAIAAARETQVYAWADELQALDEKILAAKQELEEAEKELVVAREELEAVPAFEDYLVELPRSFREMRTDADGEFSIRLRSDRRYVLLAQTERLLRGETMRLHWFVWTSPEDGAGRILLSNHNLISSTAPENVVTVKLASGTSNS